MNQIGRYPTDFSRHLYLYSPLSKNTIELFKTYPNIFEDIASSFCIRTKTFFDGSRLSEFDHPIVMIQIDKEQETLEFYYLWSTSWRLHGYEAPFLDIQYA